MHCGKSMKQHESPESILQRMAARKIGNVNLMEVCGTHTMSIAKSGIRSLLPQNVKLLSGPGCPVCVTPPEVIDAYLALAMEKDIILCTYGDLMRVPGSARGDNLHRRKALGAQVEIVYSPLDALELAKEKPERQVVFLGAGFETTAPGTAVALLEAKAQGVSNFTVLSMLKRVEPALRALMQDPEFNVQGFLCPGHVATILGEGGFRFLPEEYQMPAVIAGFEPEEILNAIDLLLEQIESHCPRLQNAYPAAVRPEGNPAARKVMEQVLMHRDDLWRGLGSIPQSGLGLRPEYADWDAEKRFQLTYVETKMELPCRCGEVIQGKLSPQSCPLFGTVCVPEEPVGPCMVSGEGACAAAYKYAL